MNWEQITNAINQFFDKPIVVTLSGILTVVGAIFVFLSKTSIGKKAIKNLTSLYTLGVERADVTLKKVEEVQTLATNEIKALKDEYERKANELKQEYEQKASTLVSICNFYVESTFSALEKIPNLKVQEEVKTLREEYANKKEEISNVIGVIYQDYTSFKEKTINSIKKEYEEKIQFLEDKYKELALFINELKEGTNNGQGEETINSNPTEEEIQED